MLKKNDPLRICGLFIVAGVIFCGVVGGLLGAAIAGAIILIGGAG